MIQANKRFYSQKEKELLLIQAQNYSRIISDSMKIVQTTKNLSTLVSRIGIAAINFDRMSELLETRAISFDKSPLELKAKAYNEANDRICTLASIELESIREVKAKGINGKTEKAFQKHELQISECLGSLQCEADNFVSSSKVITDFLNEVISIKNS